MVQTQKKELDCQVIGENFLFFYKEKVVISGGTCWKVIQSELIWLSEEAKSLDTLDS